MAVGGIELDRLRGLGGRLVKLVARVEDIGQVAQAPLDRGAIVRDLRSASSASAKYSASPRLAGLLD